MKIILLVEDSRLLRQVGAKILEKAGYSVITAGDGEEALILATTSAPDLILLDMLLPKLSGLEVLKALRQNPTTARIPVVVMSGLTQKNERKLKADGATAYFEKSRLELDKGADTLAVLVTETLNGVEAKV